MFKNANGTAEDTNLYHQLEGWVTELERLASGNRIATLSAAGNAALADLVRVMAGIAQRNGLDVLADQAITLAKLLGDRADFRTFALRMDQYPFLVAQAIDNLIKEARRSLQRDRVRARCKDERPVVLVVDDESFELSYLRRALSDIADVETATNLSDALHALDRLQPDMIILDVNLGSSDGISILRALRDDERFRETPVMMRSNRVDEDTVVAGLVNGALDFMSKALTVDQVRRRVHDTLNASQPRLFGDKSDNRVSA